MENKYLQQVMSQKDEVERDLRTLKPPAFKRKQPNPSTEEPGQNASPPPAIDVRITGYWFWRRVVVPPNAYVIHTRQGRKEPLHCDLGVSFRYDARRDAFMVVPAAMQTIVVNANCICRERQGILVQGYVQWMIGDFQRAYKRLDFSEPNDPMRVVNVQLREQAEATIKDVVATMSIDEVLADKQPIIESLTHRLRHVAEGEGEGEGLGLRIVTVQIKEAVVSSARLWETLQRPFRAEREKTARLAELEHASQVERREDQETRARAAMEIEREAAVRQMRAQAEAEDFDQSQREKGRRAHLEAQIAEETEQLARAVQENKAALALLELELSQKREALKDRFIHARQKAEIEIDAARQAVANDLSDARLRAMLLERLPELARCLPSFNALRTLSLDGKPMVDALLEWLQMRLGNMPPSDFTAGTPHHGGPPDHFTGQGE